MVVLAFFILSLILNKIICHIIRIKQQVFYALQYSPPQLYASKVTQKSTSSKTVLKKETVLGQRYQVVFTILVKILSLGLSLQGADNIFQNFIADCC